MSLAMRPATDFSSGDEFSDFDEAQDTKSKNAREQKQKIALDEKDSEEEELERLVLGNKSGFLDQLFKYTLSRDFRDGDHSGEVVRLDAEGDDDDLQFMKDEDLFAFDTDFNALKKPAANEGEGAGPNGPAWHDSDDDRGTVSLASRNMLRKLRLTENEDVIDGREYTRRLQLQYIRLNGELPKWAQQGLQKPPQEGRPSKHRRRSSAGGSDSEDSSDDDEAGPDPTTLPLSNFFRDIRNFQTLGTKRRKLRPEVLDIQRTRDIPDTHAQAVVSLAFHPQHPLLLSASRSSLLHLHRIDASAYPTPNPCITTVQVARVPLRRAAFLGPEGSAVLLAGRRKYMHSWDLNSGNVTKLSHIQGHKTKADHKTFEKFRPSPCGRYVAILGSTQKHGGTISIVLAASMQWIAEMRLDSRGGVADFQWWRDGGGLTVLGRAGNVGEYSLASRTIIALWTDEGSVGGTILALGGTNGPAMLGTDRWVAVGCNSGVLNIYDRSAIFKVKKAKVQGADEGDLDVEVVNQGRPEPTRRLEQLITSITIATFSPDGQLLAFGSREKRDALRIVHMPSCTVYRNWPTAQTPLGRITAVAISKDGVLAVGNDTGKTRLWEIRG